MDEKKKEQLKRQNEWIKENCYRFTVTMQKKEQELIEKRFKDLGYKKVGEYVRDLIKRDIESK